MTDWGGGARPEQPLRCRSGGGGPAARRHRRAAKQRPSSAGAGRTVPAAGHAGPVGNAAIKGVRWARSPMDGTPLAFHGGKRRAAQYNDPMPALAGRAAFSVVPVRNGQAGAVAVPSEGVQGRHPAHPPRRRTSPSRTGCAGSLQAPAWPRWPPAALGCTACEPRTRCRQATAGRRDVHTLHVAMKQRLGQITRDSALARLDNSIEPARNAPVDKARPAHAWLPAPLAADLRVVVSW